MEEEAPLDAFHRNNYHLFVDVLNRLMQETASEAMLAFYKLVWRYFTRWWSELSPAQVCGLNKNLAERIGGLLSRTPSLKSIQQHLQLDGRIFPASRSVNNEATPYPRDWTVYVENLRSESDAQHLPWCRLAASHNLHSVPASRRMSGRAQPPPLTFEQVQWKQLALEMAAAPTIAAAEAVARNETASGMSPVEARANVRVSDGPECAEHDHSDGQDHDHLHRPRSVRDDEEARMRVRHAWGVDASSSSPVPVQKETQPKHHGWTPINAPRPRSTPNNPQSSHSHTAHSLARISHYYAAQHYRLDGRRWEMQAQL